VVNQAQEDEIEDNFPWDELIWASQ
jgi:hypothetical protein